MGLNITPQEKVKEYYEKQLVNQSLLKGLLSGLDSFLADQDKIELYYSEKPHFVLGSAVDILLTGEEGAFDEEFYVSELEKKPSDSVMSIIQMIYDVSDGKDLEELDEEILKAVKYHKWNQNYLDKTKIRKIKEFGLDYFKELKNSSGKQIISREEKNLVDTIVTNFKNKFPIFNREEVSGNEDMEVYYQYPIYFKLNDIECKALIDILIVKREGDKIVSVQPIDIKTMGDSTTNFPKSLKRFRYDIQAAFYTQALISHFNIEERQVIRNFIFIVESTKYPGNPLTYVVDDILLDIGLRGRPAIEYNQLDDEENLLWSSELRSEIKGFIQLLQEYVYYKETEWKIDAKIAQHMNKDGYILIDWDGMKKVNYGDKQEKTMDE